VLTSARMIECEVPDTLVSGEERTMYADKTYESKTHRTRLWAQAIKELIMHGSNRHQRGLPCWQQRRHALIVLVRVPMEHLLGR